jgi:hypothetical protein
MVDFSLIISLADKLGALQAVKTRLLQHPDEAADKLVLVLDELSKIFTVIEMELASYLSLYFEPGEDVRDERAMLLNLEAGAVEMRVEEARGHCHKIENVYWKYLHRWFERALRPAEAHMLQDIFSELTVADEGMLVALGELVRWLGPKATETLDLVDAGESDRANQLIREARKEILPARQALVRALSSLRGMQAEFIAVAGTV